MTQLKKCCQWQCVELGFTAERGYKNPFRDVKLKVNFTHEAGSQIDVAAFWNGGNAWVARFTPTLTGRWTWQSFCNNEDTSLTGLSGSLECGPALPAEDNPNNRGFVRVSDNGRYFEYADGTPFYWLGDTLWRIYTARCDAAMLCRYITDRKAKGFTVVQLVAGRPGGDIKDWAGLTDHPFWYGSEAGEPYEKRFSLINPEYFKLLDGKITMLLEAGLLPCIIGFWGWDLKMGRRAAREYWDYLLARYSAYNVMWSAAGEYLFTPDEVGWRSLGRHIYKSDPYKHPLSMHSVSPTSGSRHFHHDKWCGFHMPQVGHVLAFKQQIEQLPIADYRMHPPKPSIMAESWYENHPNIVGTERGRIGAADIRFAAYVSLLQGCIGQTYGAHGIWSMYNQADYPFWDEYGRPDKWENDLELPGSLQMKYLKDAFLSVDWPNLVPMPGNIATPQFTHGYLAGVAGCCYLAYVTGRQCDVMLFLEPGHDYAAQWMDPRSGIWLAAQGQSSRWGTWLRWSTVTPESGDWVLIIKEKS